MTDEMKNLLKCSKN